MRSLRNDVDEAVRERSESLVRTLLESVRIASVSLTGEGIGDTHLRTFSGFFYDFQASGEFVLAKTGPGFEVQSRQVSGAPTWPNASVNSAVGARMGNTRVSVCLPNRLEVDGDPTEVEEGKPLELPGGVDVSRTGSVYLVRGQGGNSMRAQVHDGWIDVNVGLGRWPSQPRGLLASAGGKVDQLATSKGEVLSQPISFEDLYSRYGDSWRVPASRSFLCGKKVEPGDPKKPFTAEDLDPKLAKRARAVCTEAGVRKEGALLDSCILDVAVIEDPTAAKVYVGAPQPAAVGPQP